MLKCQLSAALLIHLNKNILQNPGEIYNKGFSYIQFKDLRVSAGYYFERYKRNDYALDNFPDPVDAIVVSDPKDILLGSRT